MEFLSFLLYVLGFIVLFGIGAAIALFFLGRKLFLSWRKPYKKANDSLQRLAHAAHPFLDEFTRHPLFRQWLRTDARQELPVLTVLFCAADQQTKNYILSSLPKYEQKRLHATVKQKRKFTNEDVNYAVSAVRAYMDDEYHHPGKKHDLSFYKLYFYDDYAQAISYIENRKRAVTPALGKTIDDIIALVLQNIPYYRERRMYEQTHKFEMLLTKDLPEMLELISQLPPAKRQEKENELALYLADFRQELEEAENSMYSSVNHALNVKMRATKEKFYTN
ncbi:MAG: DUF3974 domain-containing protein [Ectobacillus sp.]